MTDRLERAVAALGAEHEPKPGWEARVMSSIAGARVEDAVAGLGADHEPKLGWQARVLAATAEKPRRRWWKIALPALAMAAAIALVMWWSRPAPTAPLALAVATEHTGPVVRGSHSVSRTHSTGTFGDILHATASGGAHRAVWIFGTGEQLAVSCPGPDVRCRAERNAVIADLTLDTPGTYIVVALAASSPIAAPSGTYDHAMAAVRGGSTAVEEHEVVVR